MDSGMLSRAMTICLLGSLVGTMQTVIYARVARLRHASVITLIC